MSNRATCHHAPIRVRLARGLVLVFLFLLSAAAFAKGAAPPRPPAVGIAALRSAGADLAVDLWLAAGAPAKLVVSLETAAGQAKGSALLSPSLPGPATVTLPGAVERFLTDGYEYRLRLRDGNGAEAAPPFAFSVGMSCEGEVCRFVPEPGVRAGAAVWLDERLAAALRAADPATPDLLAAAVAEDPGLLGAARNLAARLAGSADGLCHCRWAYSTPAASCIDPGVSLGIYDRGVRQDGLSARQVWSGTVRVNPACWTVQPAGEERIRISWGARLTTVSWPRLRLSACGACSGLATMDATFVSGAYALASSGNPGVSTRASWAYSAAADGIPVLVASDVRTAASPGGEERFELTRDWTGTAGAVDWQIELEAELEAPRGLDRGVAAAQIAFDIRSTAEAACATPPQVEVGKVTGWRPLADPLLNPIDPNQISVVIGECRPPR